jgi:hypothetical protein
VFPNKLLGNNEGAVFEIRKSVLMSSFLPSFCKILEKFLVIPGQRPVNKLFSPSKWRCKAERNPATSSARGRWVFRATLSGSDVQPRQMFERTADCREFVMAVNGVHFGARVSGQLHPQLLRHTAIGQHGVEAVAQAVER